MDHDRSEWTGTLSARPADDEIGLFVRTPLQQSSTGGSGTFLAEASDGRKWWVKPANNQQGGKVVATEFAVAGLGGLIDAPVCLVEAIRIGPEIAGWEFRPGNRLVAGTASASLAVDDVHEEKTLTSVERDDNQVRVAGVLALYDWCWGGDGQWLYCDSGDLQIHSHDHGWYLPEEGADWSEAAIMARLHEAHPLGTPLGFDGGNLEPFAARLEGITQTDVLAVLRGVPASWPVTDTDLEALGFFVLTRASEVADRLRSIVGGSAT